MFGILNKYIAVFLTGFVVTYVLTPAVRTFAIRHKMVDLPNERRPHKRPTARGGGIAVFFGVHAACLAALLLPWPKLAGGLDLQWWLPVAGASVILFVVGVIDDARGLKPLTKLAGQAAAALVVAIGGTRFGSLFGVELPRVLDSLLVVFWILAVINAFNLIDGLDGLASGLACISGIGLGGIFVLQHLSGNLLVILGLIGACLAFLRYNLHPATIFLGDTGSMFLGLILGVVSLQTFTKSTFLLSLTIPMLVLGVPIYDALLAIWRRSVRAWLAGDQPGGKPKLLRIMQPDLDHLHHRLLKAGMSTRRVATFLCIGNAVLVISGLLITTFTSHAAGMFLIILLAGAFVLMRHLALIELRDTGTALMSGLRRPANTTLKALAYPFWDMFWMAGSVAVAMWLFEPPKTNFWTDWFEDLPVWVTPSLSLLAFSDTYVTVWSRARMRDVLKVFFILQSGLLLSLGIALFIDPYNEPRRWLLRAWLVGGLSHPAIMGLRIIYRFIEELVGWAGAKGGEGGQPKRIVLYGAGGRCWLFLRERALKKNNETDGRRIVGIIDDDSSLHAQWVYGFKVLGPGKDLLKLATLHRFTEIVITADLNLEARTALEQIVRLNGFGLSEWICREQELVRHLESPVPPIEVVSPDKAPGTGPVCTDTLLTSRPLA